VIVPPVVVALYGFRQLFTSLFYMGLTVYLLIAFLAVGQLSRRLSDRVLVLCGWLCVGAGTLVLLLSDVVNGPPRLWQFAFGALVFSTSSAFFETSVPSLFSKVRYHLKSFIWQTRTQHALVLLPAL
jgi:MFS family permease